MIIFGQSSSNQGVQIDWGGAGWAATTFPVGASTFPHYFYTSKFWVQQAAALNSVNINLFAPTVSTLPFSGAVQDLPRSTYRREYTSTFYNVILNVSASLPFSAAIQDLPQTLSRGKQFAQTSGANPNLFPPPAPSAPFPGTSQDLPRGPYRRKQEFRSGTWIFQTPTEYLGTSKFLGYAVLSPPQNAVSVSKFVAYAILQPVPLWRYAPYWPNPIPPRFPQANRGWINQTNLSLGVPSSRRGRTIFTYMG